MSANETAKNHAFYSPWFSFRKTGLER